MQDNAVLHLADQFACELFGHVSHAASMPARWATKCQGMGAIILDGAVIGKQSNIGAKALVTQGTKFRPALWCSVHPAKW